MQSSYSSAWPVDCISSTGHIFKRQSGGKTFFSILLRPEVWTHTARDKTKGESTKTRNTEWAGRTRTLKHHLQSLWQKGARALRAAKPDSCSKAEAELLTHLQPAQLLFCASAFFPPLSLRNKLHLQTLIRTDVHTANILGTKSQRVILYVRAELLFLILSLSLSVSPGLLSVDCLQMGLGETERERDVGGKSGSHAQREREWKRGRRGERRGRVRRSERITVTGWDGVRERGRETQRGWERETGGGREGRSNSLVEKEWISHRPRSFHLISADHRTWDTHTHTHTHTHNNGTQHRDAGEHTHTHPHTRWRTHTHKTNIDTKYTYHRWRKDTHTHTHTHTHTQTQAQTQTQYVCLYVMWRLTLTHTHTHTRLPDKLNKSITL